MDSNQVIYSFYLCVSKLWSSVLCGSQNEKQAEIYNYMKNFKVGDFVMENSSGFKAVKLWENGEKEDAVTHLKQMFGTLEKIEMEEFQLNEEARQDYIDGGEEIPKEKVFYIKNLHGVLFRWTNADFLRVPSEYHLEAR